jgi:hypothetical protein
MRADRGQAGADTMTPQNFATAIAIVESGNRSNPPMRDGGQARGRYQMHPSFWQEWVAKLNITAQLGETWDSLDTRIVQGYFTVRTGQGLTALEAAVSFHVGHICREGDDTWDAQYAADFAAAVGTLTG